MARSVQPERAGLGAAGMPTPKALGREKDNGTPGSTHASAGSPLRPQAVGSLTGSQPAFRLRYSTACTGRRNSEAGKQLLPPDSYASSAMETLKLAYPRVGKAQLAELRKAAKQLGRE